MGVELLNGFLAGMRVKQFTPDTYIYNGVELPDVCAKCPDKEKYPYILLRNIDTEDGIDISVIYTTKPFIYQYIQTDDYVGWNVAIHILSSESTSESCYTAYLRDGQWDKVAFAVNEWDVGQYQGFYLQSLGSPFWANHTIYHEDGTVYMETTNPLPVYK